MITVPLSALSQPDDAGASVAPEVGDTIDLGKAQAKVTAINGDNASLDIESINGTKCSAAGADSEGVDDSEPVDDPRTGMPMNDAGAALMRRASAADKRAGLS